LEKFNLGSDNLALYGISDLHLSLASEKPMDVFGEMWENHHIKIMNNWNSKIKKEDTVIIAGDISWALKFEDAIPDLDFVHKLNGKKVLLKGNHDYWWGSISKLNSLYEDMFFIQNNSYKYENYGICGTRGWINIDGYNNNNSNSNSNKSDDEQDEKVYTREVIRLKISLDSAVKSGVDKLIVMMHYPPITKICKSPEFLELISEYKVEKLIYGHVHNDAKAICINGFVGDTEYICTSADIIHFDPVLILED
jgi:uncharacterized protein